MLRGEIERRAVAAGKQRVLVVIAAAPHRTDGMDDVARLEPMAAR